MRILEEIIEKYKKIQKRDKIQKIILGIIIIILIVLWILSYRLGKIGYQYVSTIPNNEDIKLIKITDENGGITQNTKLNIFKNEKFGGKKIITPQSKGEYSFCIKNVSDKDVSYDINFEDEMSYHINMKYRLKMDNLYVKGNEEEFLNVNELNLEDIIVYLNSLNIFTLEWYWEDDDELDSIVGSSKNDEQYILNLKIKAEEYENKGGEI